MAEFNPTNKEPQVDDTALESLKLIGKYLHDARTGAVPLKVSDPSAGGGEIASNVIYVDPSGDDETGDGSAENPFATPRKGLEEATAGKTVHVWPGSYTESAYSLDISELSGVTLHLEPGVTWSIFTDTGSGSVIADNDTGASTFRITGRGVIAFTGAAVADWTLATAQPLYGSRIDIEALSIDCTGATLAFQGNVFITVEKTLIGNFSALGATAPKIEASTFSGDVTVNAATPTIKADAWAGGWSVDALGTLTADVKNATRPTPGTFLILGGSTVRLIGGRYDYTGSTINVGGSGTDGRLRLEEGMKLKGGDIAIPAIHLDGFIDGVLISDGATVVRDATGAPITTSGSGIIVSKGLFVDFATGVSTQGVPETVNNYFHTYF